MHALLLLALFQAAPAGEPLRSGCSADDSKIASVSPGDRVEVETALAGDEKTCYRLALTKPGQPPAVGYVLGEDLPAVAAFVRQREKVSGESAKAEAQRRLQQALAPKPDDPAKPAAVDPLVSTQFEEFSGRNSAGKMVSLADLSGRVTVVTFWSPKNRGNQSALMALDPLYNMYHKSGLKAVGVSMDPNYGHITEALDDVTTNFPQVADQSGLAARYHVDPRAGKTFVLDASHRIVAAGPMGPDIAQAVQRLLAAP